MGTKGPPYRGMKYLIPEALKPEDPSDTEYIRHCG